MAVETGCSICEDSSELIKRCCYDCAAVCSHPGCTEPAHPGPRVCDEHARHVNDQQPNYRCPKTGQLVLFHCYNCGRDLDSASRRECPLCGWSEMEALDLSPKGQSILEGMIRHTLLSG